MNKSKIINSVALLLCTAMALPAEAAPRLITATDVKATKTTYSFFYIDFNKVQLARTTAQTTLQSRLTSAGEGITACIIPADLNATNINCGNGAVRFGPDFFSYHNATHIPVPTLNFTAADADSGLDSVSIEYGNNALSPTVVNQPTQSPRVFQIRFNKRVAQFGFVIDPFIQTDPTVPLDEGRLLDGVQFIVNRQATPLRDLTKELRGNVHFVGVEDPHGFTEVTVVATGNGAVLADQYTIVPLSGF
ncbi:MAG: hypothetical protein HOP23_12170 [Methylococcaceae bacterium]|nr:hypothetical protein [Methylococcaceae bacterium]